MDLQLKIQKKVCGTNGGFLIASCFVMIHDAGRQFWMCYSRYKVGCVIE